MTSSSFLNRPRGEKIEERWKDYDHETDHSEMVLLFGLNILLCSSGRSALPLLFHFCEPERAYALFKSVQMSSARKVLEEMNAHAGLAESNPFVDTLTVSSLSVNVPTFYLLGREAEGHAMMVDIFGDYFSIERLHYLWTSKTPLYTKQPGEEQDPNSIFDSQIYIWYLKLMWILTAPQGSFIIPIEQALEGMPDPRAAAINGRGSLQHNQLFHCSYVMHWVSAFAMEKLGLTDKALEFAELAVETDVTKGGNDIKWNQSLGWSCKGRVLTSLGRLDEAVEAFAKGVKVAEAGEFLLLQAVSLRDWNEAVPAGTPAAQETADMLKAVMNRMCDGASEATQAKAKEFLSTLCKK